jgi:hypothetical protein
LPTNTGLFNSQHLKFETTDPYGPEKYKHAQMKMTTAKALDFVQIKFKNITPKKTTATYREK